MIAIGGFLVWNIHASLFLGHIIELKQACFKCTSQGPQYAILACLSEVPEPYTVYIMCSSIGLEGGGYLPGKWPYWKMFVYSKSFGLASSSPQLPFYFAGSVPAYLLFSRDG